MTRNDWSSPEFRREYYRKYRAANLTRLRDQERARKGLTKWQRQSEKGVRDLATWQPQRNYGNFYFPSRGTKNGKPLYYA